VVVKDVLLVVLVELVDTAVLYLLQQQDLVALLLHLFYLEQQFKVLVELLVELLKMDIALLVVVEALHLTLLVVEVVGAVLEVLAVLLLVVYQYLAVLVAILLVLEHNPAVVVEQAHQQTQMLLTVALDK
jgi:hypothetical protein